jgi:predicted secreted protein
VKWTSILAIYALFWVFCAFLVLPWGVRTPHEDNIALVPGQAESAPHNFSLKRTAIRTTIVATSLFALFLLNYIFGWITTDTLDWTRWG